MKLDNQGIQKEAARFLETLFRLAGLNLQARLEFAEGNMLVTLEGEDSGLVLADNARLLYAVNHLLNQSFHRRSVDRCNFVVDCEQYRAGRILELELLARKAGEKVRLSGIPLSLQPMPSSERRIIHLALAQEQGIRTESEGSGLHRCVRIVPVAES